MSLRQQTSDWEQVREAILERDQRRCSCCGRPEQVVHSLDVHHIVPRGAGGSDRFKNYQLLCRQCHDAAEREAIAPGIELQSTGRMDQYTFLRFKHFFNEMIPAMGRTVGVRIEPEFGLHDKRDFWHIALGDLKLMDAVLPTIDDQYRSLRTVDYM